MTDLALESTVIAHGLPYPQNLETARALEAIARAHGVTPRTIAILGGEIKIGLSDAELEYLARARDVLKLARRDLALAIAQKRDGATTVSATMYLAHRAGIRVFATGGIGGVHRQGECGVQSSELGVRNSELGVRNSEFGVRNSEFGVRSSELDTEHRILNTAPDVSADLPELARTPVVVVCAGAKAILDLPATLEWLETFGVPVLGYQTDEFPAFYSRASGLCVPARVDSIEQAARVIKTHWDLGLTSGVLMCVPIPPADEIPREVIEPHIARALSEEEAQHIIGGAVTPFVLKRLAELTNGATVRANIALLKNNVAVAAEMAKALDTLR
ncbi:MAG: pseudouridine-5'-phosphate glycosidase [Anaerolineae bacterium]|nr:pseudouridine-5'-phosphate glycosidase [Anaerolineae bacterium]